MMARGTRKRKSEAEIIYTTPNLQQARFPSDRRTLRSKQSPWSAPSKRQQTITQMDQFRQLYHPDSDEEELDMEEIPVDLDEQSPQKPKRRKIKDTPVRKMQTRNAAKMTESVSEPGRIGKRILEIQDGEALEESKPIRQQQTMTQMLPPKTPQKRMKLEIPSSQSPPDTPLSTQSHRSRRDMSNSPLKDKSPNIKVVKSSPLKSVRLAKGIEIADSMENDEIDGSESSNFSQRVTPINMKIKPPQYQISEAPQSDPVEALPLENGSRSLHDGTLKDHVNVMAAPKVRHFRKEVSNSEKDDEEQDEEVERPDFVCRFETQASSVPIPSSVVPDPGLWGYIGSMPNNTAIAPNHRSQFRQSNIENETIRDIEQPEPSSQTSPHQSKSDGEEPDLIPSTPIARPQYTESDEASAQLHADLQRVVQPAVLETNSQFEDAWESYHPQDLGTKEEEEEEEEEEEKDPHSDPQSDSPPPIECIESSQPTTIPIQPLPILSHKGETHQRAGLKKMPVPPSQATTVDMTQPSLRKTQPSSSQQFHSSPPPMPPLSSSSPLVGRKPTDLWTGCEWNGVRLTDSQLLPASLMDDSFLGPPEDLGCEMEEYE